MAQDTYILVWKKISKKSKSRKYPKKKNYFSKKKIRDSSSQIPATLQPFKNVVDGAYGYGKKTKQTRKRKR